MLLYLRKDDQKFLILGEANTTRIRKQKKYKVKLKSKPRIGTHEDSVNASFWSKFQVDISIIPILAIMSGELEHCVSEKRPSLITLLLLQFLRLQVFDLDQ